MKAILEICAADWQSVRAAVDGGADRIELCQALSEGGLTPSAGFISKARNSGIPRLHVLIRPRSGDFVYSPEEIEIMCRDIRMAAFNGADGVVVGALTPQGDIDTAALREFRLAAGDMGITFHRAFDLCRNPLDALEIIIEAGCGYLLTSGLAQSALEGAGQLRQLNDAVAGRISIIAAAGVNSRNATEIIRLSGVGEIHASASRPVDSSMTFRRTDVSMGAKDRNEFSRNSTSREEVEAIKKAIQ